MSFIQKTKKTASQVTPSAQTLSVAPSYFWLAGTALELYVVLAICFVLFEYSCPTKSAFGHFFWTDKGEQMQTAQYWLWYAFYPMTAVFLIAIMFRFIAWRMGLSRWEDL